MYFYIRNASESNVCVCVFTDSIYTFFLLLFTTIPDQGFHNAALTDTYNNSWTSGAGTLYTLLLFPLNVAHLIYSSF